MVRVPVVDGLQSRGNLVARDALVEQYLA